MNSNLSVLCRAASALILVATLSGCGGGSFVDPVVYIDDPVTVSGTAASGRPIAGATVTVKDAAGHTATQTTNNNGEYGFSVASNFVWPLVARVEGGTLECGARANCAPAPNTGRYVGVSLRKGGGDNRINLTPMSHAVVTSAAHVDANHLFDAPLALLLLNPLDLIDATVTVLDWLLRLDPEALLPRNLDFVNGSFIATPADPQDVVLELLQFVFTTLLLDQSQFGLLVLTSPHGSGVPAVPLYCDVAGSYQGSYAGTRQGTWSATIDAYTGLISGNASNPAGGPGVAGLGTVVRVGLGTRRTSAALGFAGLAQFAGGIDAGRVFAGTWSSPAEVGGTFTGQRGGVASICR
jgi:hypothetical protein